MDFNPRSREGSDFSFNAFPRDCKISIHAPVKGATHLAVVMWSALWYFNPRSREGSDQQVFAQDSTWTNISIHAPVKGATRSRL